VAKSLKQQLLERPDAREKAIEVRAFASEPPYTCTIRRLTVSERDLLMKDYELGQGDSQKAVEASIAIVAMAVVPGEGEERYTTDDVRQMPAAIVDLIAGEVMEFNGWTKRAKAALDDQFRPSA
jgi:hypothetical protein